MALCGHSNCSCAIEAGSGVAIDGSGTAADPWVINYLGADGGTQVIYTYANTAALAVDFPSPPTNMLVYFTDDDRLMRWTGSAWTPHYGGQAIVSRTATQSISGAGASNTVAFNATDIFDPLAWHDTVTNNDRVSPGVAGIYEVTMSVTMETIIYLSGVFTPGWEPDRVAIGILLNGSATGIRDEFMSNSQGLAGRTMSQYVNATSSSDYFGMYVIQQPFSGSAARNMTAARMSVRYVSPL